MLDCILDLLVHFFISMVTWHTESLPSIFSDFQIYRDFVSDHVLLKSTNASLQRLEMLVFHFTFPLFIWMLIIKLEIWGRDRDGIRREWVRRRNRTSPI